jgi:hypothetical protein
MDFRAEGLATWSGTRPGFETSQNRKVVKMVSPLKVITILDDKQFRGNKLPKNLWAVFYQKLLVDLSFNLLSIEPILLLHMDFNNYTGRCHLNDVSYCN